MSSFSEVTATKLNKNPVIQTPAYYAPDDTNIFPPKGALDKKDSLITRIFYSVLPFIALHRPFGQAITFIMDITRICSSFDQLIENQSSKELFKTTIAISALAGTLFMHPLGLCISTLQNLGYDVSTVITHLQTSHLQDAMHSLFTMTQHLLYLGVMTVGSLEVIALAMLFNMAVEVCRSKKEFKKGNLIESFSHLLMSMVRFFQAAPYIEKVAYKNNFKGKEITTNLNKTMSKIRDNISIFFYLAGRFFAEPHWKLTEKLLNTVSLYKDDKASTTQKVIDTTTSVFATILFFPFTLGSLAIGQACHFSAYLSATTPYIHIKNPAKLKPLNNNFSFFQLNCCLTAGGFSKLFGGTVIPNDQRVLKIVEMIKQKDPDIVCMQEVSDIKDAYQLYKELSDNYGDFYFNIGATPFILQNNSGLFVASKTQLENPQLYSFSDIPDTESMVNKCYFVFSTNNANFITTHLSPTHDDLNPTSQETFVRTQEQERILTKVKEISSKNNKPTFVSGDFNINWDSKEYQTGSLFNEGNDFYNKDRKEVTPQDATAETDYLINRNWHHNNKFKHQNLILDYFVSFFNPTGSVKTQKIATFDINNPQNAVSDHSALLTQIKV